MAADSSPQTMLHTLPTEIIKRIATFLPCQSAHALMRTNHQFYLTVNDRLVFRSMLDDLESSNPALTPLWISRVSSILPPDCPPSAWARFALADDKARALMDPPSRLHSRALLDPLASPKPFEWHVFLAWAPQLLLLHHPLLTSPHFFASVPPKILIGLSPGLDLALSLLILQHGVTTLGAHHTLRRQTFTHLATLKKHLLHYRTYAQSRPRTVNALAVFLCGLLELLQANVLTGRGGPVVWPPAATDIPFASFMELPLPFAGRGGDRTFQSCHVRGMANKAFLEAGKWTAYYSLTTDFAVDLVMGFQPPVVDIQFVATEATSAGMEMEKGLLQLKATGADHAGPFTATGLFHADGKMKMLETNWLGQNWVWSLQMTPLGLFGTWGAGHDVHGFLWVFKKEWCHKPVGGEGLVQ